MLFVLLFGQCCWGAWGAGTGAAVTAAAGDGCTCG